MKRATSPHATLPPTRRPYDSYRATAPRASGSGSRPPASTSSHGRTAGTSPATGPGNAVGLTGAKRDAGRREDGGEEEDLVGELGRREGCGQRRGFALRSPFISAVPDSPSPEPQQQYQTHASRSLSWSDPSSLTMAGEDEDIKPDFSTYRERDPSPSTTSNLPLTTNPKLSQLSPTDTDDKPDVKDIKPKIENSFTPTLASTAARSSTDEDDKKPLERYVASPSSSNRNLTSQHPSSHPSFSQRPLNHPSTATKDDNKNFIDSYSSSSSSRSRPSHSHFFSHPSSSTHSSDPPFLDLKPPKPELDDDRDRSRAPSPPEEKLIRLDAARFEAQLPARKPKKEEYDDEGQREGNPLEDDGEAMEDEEMGEEWEVDMEPPPMLSVEELAMQAMKGVPMREEETPMPGEEDAEEVDRFSSVATPEDETCNGYEEDGFEDEEDGFDEDETPKRTTSVAKEIKEEKVRKGFTTMGPPPRWEKAQKSKNKQIESPQVEPDATPAPHPVYRPIGAKTRLTSLMGLRDPVAPPSRPDPKPLQRRRSPSIDSPTPASPPAELRRRPSVEEQHFPAVDPKAWPTVERAIEAPSRSETTSRAVREESLDSLADYEEEELAAAGFDLDELFTTAPLPPQTRSEAIRSWFVQLLPNSDRIDIDDDYNHQVLTNDVDFLRQREIHRAPSYLLSRDFFDGEGNSLLVQRPGGGNALTAQEMLKVVWDDNLGTAPRYLPRCEPERRRSWEEAVVETREKGLEVDEVRRVLQEVFCPYTAMEEGVLQLVFARNWVWFEHVLHLARIRKASFALASEHVVDALQASYEHERNKLIHHRQDLEQRMQTAPLQEGGSLNQELRQITRLHLPELDERFSAIIARMKRRLEESQ